jgi:hypothetical protein
MENKNLACNSRGAAISALETLADILPRGTQREALIAVRNWIDKNTTPTRSPEEQQKWLDNILKKSEGEKKGWEWYERGSEDIGGKLVPTTPEDGTEWTCRYNAKAKRWEPTSLPPPMQKKSTVKK